MLLISALFYSLTALNVRMLSDGGIPIGFSLFLRTMAQGGVAGASMFAKRIHPWRGARSLRLLLLRATSGAVAFTLYFVASTLAPLGDANAICSLYPVGTMIGAAVLLNERVDGAGWCALIACVAGVWLLATGASAAELQQLPIISGGLNGTAAKSGSGAVAIGYAAAGGSALAAAACILSMRDAFHPLQGVLAQACIQAIVGVCLWAAEGRPPRVAQGAEVTVGAELAAMLACSVGALILLSYGLPLCRAGVR